MMQGTYVLALRGISAFSTVCTPGMSRPRAATSVQTYRERHVSKSLVEISKNGNINHYKRMKEKKENYYSHSTEEII